MLALLRGNLEDEQVGVVIATLILLRWADQVEASDDCLEAFNESRFGLSLPASLRWRSWCGVRDSHELSQIIRDIAFALKHDSDSASTAANSKRRHIVNAVASLTNCRPDALLFVVIWLSRQPFDSAADRLSLRSSLDEIRQRTSAKWSGQYSTPIAITQLMVEIAEPKFGESIYDPCFGSAGLLTEATDYVQRHYAQTIDPDRPLVRIAGVEINNDAYTIGLARLVLSGVYDARLELGDSLEQQSLVDSSAGKFDLVLANPPWGKKLDLKESDRYLIPSTDAVSLFIQHALSQLRPGGRAVMVVPPGNLFRSGRDKALRQMLLEAHSVDAVVAIPAGSFKPYTSIPSCILAFHKGGATRSVRMVDAARLQKGPISTGEFWTPGEVVQEIRTLRPSQYAWDVDVATLAELDFDLSPKRRDQNDLKSVLRGLPSKVKVVPLRECCRVIAQRPINPSELSSTPPGELGEPRSVEEISDEIHQLQSELHALSSHGLTEGTQKAGAVLKRLEACIQELEQRHSTESNQVPYIHIRDVQHGEVLPTSTWLSANVVSEGDQQRKLQSGDVLLSKSGAVGKVAIVRSRSAGGVAANGFFVLRADPETLDPRFLLAYLQSSECRAWLGDRSGGSAAKHLSASVLNELPVPIPPLDIQRRIGEECRETGNDALALLANVLTGDKTDPIANLVDKAWARFYVNDDGADRHVSLSEWTDLAKQFVDLRYEADRGGFESTLLSWLRTFSDSLRTLWDAGSVPPGPALLSVFSESLQRAENALHVVEGGPPAYKKARALSDLLVSWIKRESSELARRVRFVFATSITELSADRPTELTLEIENQGVSPVLGLTVSTEPDWGKGNVSYLAEGAKAQIKLAGAATSESDKFSLTINWSGRTLNGEPVTGVRELGFDVIASDSHESSVSTSAATVSDLGSSPYVTGDPVTAEMFFGREELIDQIRRQIVRSGNVVLLEGNRRAGKSSVLRHLEGADAVPGWLGVYCSLQGVDGDSSGGVPTAEVFRGIAYAIVQSMRKLNGSVVLPDGSLFDSERRLGVARALRDSISEGTPFQDFREYLELILETLSKQKLGLLLLLDEYDKLQEGIDKGITSPQVPENIRFLVQSLPRFSAILTGSRRLKRMRTEYWSSLFGLGTRLGISALSFDAAARLITEPVKGKLSYAKSAVDRAYYLTAGQPYLLQCLCNRVFDIAARSGIRSITIDHVDAAATALVEDNEHFASLWDFTGFDRRRFLLYLLHREADGPNLMNLGMIQASLEATSVEIREEVLISDLEELRELELIDLHKTSAGSYYALTIPMMGQWLDKQQDIEILRSRARAEAEDMNEQRPEGNDAASDIQS